MGDILHAFDVTQYVCYSALIVAYSITFLKVWTSTKFAFVLKVLGLLALSSVFGIVSVKTNKIVYELETNSEDTQAKFWLWI